MKWWLGTDCIITIAINTIYASILIVVTMIIRVIIVVGAAAVMKISYGQIHVHRKTASFPTIGQRCQISIHLHDASSL